MAHHSVARIKKKSFSQGEDYHVGQKELEVEISWRDIRDCQIEPFETANGYKGIRIIVKEK